jgi:PAS domain S-box-containing protein
MNPIAETLTGWTISQAKGRPLFEVFHIISAITRLPAKCPVSHVLETGQIVGLANHTVLISKSGTEFQIADSAAPIRDTTGKIRGVVLVFRDVTKEYATEEALRHSRATLQAAMDQSPAGIAIADAPSGNLRYVNNAGLLMLGGTRQDMFDAVGINEYVASWKLFDLNNMPLRLAEVPLARAVMFGEANSREFIIRRTEQDDRIVSANAAPIKNDTGTVIAGIVVFTDITQQKKIENERIHLEQRLRQREKMDAIGQLAGGIAHDFNNQLAGILGYADVLINRLSDPAHVRFAQIIKTSARRAADLTKQMLAFSRKGKNLNLSIDTHQVIQEVSELLKHSIDKRVEIIHRLEAHPSNILGDPSLIQNAILNLGLNARDAMPNGGQLIFSSKNSNFSGNSLEEDIPAGKYIQISVTDTGTGMDKETQRRLFEPFFTTKEVGKGTGLGLASVYGTVKSHGGSIRVYSELGHGSSFHIYLPILVENPEEASHAEESGIRNLKRGRILVVDDEPALLGLVAEILREQGHTVDVCSDPTAGLALYKTDWASFDLVILDMIMPKIGGKDLFLALKEINPQIKSLLASGYSVNNEAQSILDAGVLDFIQKPFDRTELLKKVSEALRR